MCQQKNIYINYLNIKFYKYHNIQKPGFSSFAVNRAEWVPGLLEYINHGSPVSTAILKCSNLPRKTLLPSLSLSYSLPHPWILSLRYQQHTSNLNNMPS